jgi:hypothetical protein
MTFIFAFGFRMAVTFPWTSVAVRSENWEVYARYTSAARSSYPEGEGALTMALRKSNDSFFMVRLAYTEAARKLHPGV